MEEGHRVNVLLQVNVSGEVQKAGMPPSETLRLAELARRCKGVHVHGFMTIGPLLGKADAARRCFAELRELRDVVERRSGLKLPQLSMGMSADFEIAIEEGATILRLGTALFGPRPPERI